MTMMYLFANKMLSSSFFWRFRVSLVKFSYWPEIWKYKKNRSSFVQYLETGVS